MNLKEIEFNLVGAFECTIENNLVLCTGEEIVSREPHDIANLYSFDVLDLANSTISEIIAVVFIQVGENIEFRYRKQSFNVVSVSFGVIVLNKDGVDYFIKRTNIPVG
jgi:hypothetical protein